MGLVAIDHVQLAVPTDGLERARAFYARVFGLTDVARPAALAARAGAWLERGAVRVHLGVEADFRPARKAHPAFVVDDLDALVARCREEGCEIAAAEELPGWKRVHVFDPFGNRIELMERVG